MSDTNFVVSNGDSWLCVYLDEVTGKWKEGQVLEGSKPHGWGSKTYMGYLKPSDVLSWINRDYCDLGHWRIDHDHYNEYDDDFYR